MHIELMLQHSGRLAGRACATMAMKHPSCLDIGGQTKFRGHGTDELKSGPIYFRGINDSLDGRTVGDVGSAYRYVSMTTDDARRQYELTSFTVDVMVMQQQQQQQQQQDSSWQTAGH